jgi:hypothetical protein
MLRRSERNRRESSALTISGVQSSGTTPPVVTLSGTPTQSGNLSISITTLGIVGVALFSWSFNGVVQQTNQITASSFVLGSTGVTADFHAGTYATSDVYTATFYWTTG